MRPLRVRYFGRLPYREAWALQRDLVARRQRGEIDDHLLLLEHDPVVTLGRDGGRESMRVSEAVLQARGVELVESDRGGNATYHGPGQVVAYPILDLAPDRKDLHRLVKDLEAVMLDVCADYGVIATTLAGTPGVFVGDRKIGALGVRVARWVTHHGVALNVNTSLDAFDLIVPCGLRDKGVTSLARELGRAVPLAEVMERLADHVARRFDRALLPAGAASAAG